MVCGEAQKSEVSGWVRCWTWHGSWLCRKTTTQTLNAYNFAILRRRDRFFSANYQACCEFGGGEFDLSEW